MEAIRCSVESWAEFGLSNRANVKLLSAGTAVLFSTGSDILVFSSTDKRLSVSRLFVLCSICFSHCGIMNLTS